ncbi:uncharacterized protein METZ01_LOCUS364109, partial [marine metagenome]
MSLVKEIETTIRENDRFGLLMPFINLVFEFIFSQNPRLLLIRVTGIFQPSSKSILTDFLTISAISRLVSYENDSVVMGFPIRNSMGCLFKDQDPFSNTSNVPTNAMGTMG